MTQKEQIEAQLRKIPGVRHVQAHVVTDDGKMIEVSLFKDNTSMKESHLNEPRRRRAS